jgi:hypothetical protein
VLFLFNTDPPLRIFARLISDLNLIVSSLFRNSKDIKLYILTTTKTKTQQRWNFIKDDLTIAESGKNMSEIG